MALPDPKKAASLLHAELRVELPAREDALEIERLYAAADQRERIDRALSKVRAAIFDLEPGHEEQHSDAAALAALALTEASALEYEAAELEPLLPALAGGRSGGLLRSVCALRYLASLAEGRARADGQGQASAGMPREHLLNVLALPGFESLLKAGEAWPAADGAWLRLRAVTVPGRLRLRAAALRSGAEAAGGQALPPKLKLLESPFLENGFEKSAGLAWAVAKFNPNDAFHWITEGLTDATQAQAWRDLNLPADEAGAWAAADFAPEEAATYKACGAEYPSTALSLRQDLGDLEHLLAWHRDGFDAAEISRLRAAGVKNAAQALAQKQAAKPLVIKPAAAAPTPAPAPASAPMPVQKQTPNPAPAPKQATVPAPAPSKAVLPPPPEPQQPSFRIIRSPTAIPAPNPESLETSLPEAVPTLYPQDSKDAPTQTFGRIIRPRDLVEEARRFAETQSTKPEAAVPDTALPDLTAHTIGDTKLWAQQRAWRLFGANVDSQAEALSAAPSQGGAWMGWGAFDPDSAADLGGFFAAYTLSLAGGLMDVVAESEGFAAPGQSHVPRSLGGSLVWQQRLDRLRLERGAQSIPGKWHLYSWPPIRTKLFWGLVFKSITAPWGRSIDFDYNESWRQRWDRKAAEAGHPGLDCPCAVEKIQQGSWWIAIAPSVTGSDGPLPAQIQPRAVEEEWRTQMDDFLRIMGIPPQGARWHLLAA
jgi:hypothetical protein